MMSETDEPIADAAMDAKLRQIWAKFEKPWMRKALAECLPPSRVSSLGCDFIVHPKDNFTELKIWEKGLPPEHVATDHIADLLSGQDVTIVDVGANAGAFFLPILMRAGKKARAVAFEPNPVMRARLETNIKLNKLDKRTQVFDCAVGESEARARMFFPKNGNLGQGRVGVGYGPTGDEGDEVAIRPLAACLAEAKVTQIDFLKVDVEGLEDRVIVPLLTDPDAPKPWLVYFEVAHDAAWALPLLETMTDAGYQQDRDFGDNRLFVLQN